MYLFCYKTDFKLSLSDENHADNIKAFNSTSRYSDDLLNIDNISFEQMNGQIYPTELQLNKANSSDNELPVLDLIEVYKTMDNIDHTEKDVLFTTSSYAATRGHRLKFAKKKTQIKNSGK